MLIDVLITNKEKEKIYLCSSAFFLSTFLFVYAAKADILENDLNRMFVFAINSVTKRQCHNIKTLPKTRKKWCFVFYEHRQRKVLYDEISQTTSKQTNKLTILSSGQSHTFETIGFVRL